jgi:hypothetical protein
MQNFPVVDEEGDNHINTLDAQPIGNRSEDEQVCIFE